MTILPSTIAANANSRGVLALSLAPGFPEGSPISLRLRFLCFADVCSFISRGIFSLIVQKVPADSTSSSCNYTDNPSVFISFNCESILFFCLLLSYARTYFFGPLTLLSVNLPPELFEICLKCCLVPAVPAFSIFAPSCYICTHFAIPISFNVSLQNEEKMIKVFANWW